MVILQLKDKLPGSDTSMPIYKFSFSCGESYTGCTTRQPIKRVSEHLSSRLGKCPRNNTQLCSIDGSQAVDGNKSFLVFYRIPTGLHYVVRSRLLHIIEAIGIREDIPSLRVHKTL